jgi:hypothetical protein
MVVQRPPLPTNPGGTTSKRQSSVKKGLGSECQKNKRSSHKKKKENVLDDSFYQSVQHQLISELVGKIEDEPSSHNTSTVTVREDVKHSESNTTNHSTGDSQGSSSAEKVERRMSINEAEEAVHRTSSSCSS